VQEWESVVRLWVGWEEGESGLMGGCEGGVLGEGEGGEEREGNGGAVDWRGG